MGTVFFVVLVCVAGLLGYGFAGGFEKRWDRTLLFEVYNRSACTRRLVPVSAASIAILEPHDVVHTITLPGIMIGNMPVLACMDLMSAQGGVSHPWPIIREGMDGVEMEVQEMRGTVPFTELRLSFLVPDRGVFRKICFCVQWKQDSADVEV